MARYDAIVDEVRKLDPAIADRVAAQFKSMTSKRSYGLNFEHYEPEKVDMPRRKVSVVDKVRFIPPRGSIEVADGLNVWRVESISDAGVAELRLEHTRDEIFEQRRVENLCVVAEVSDVIFPGLEQTGSTFGSDADDVCHSVINGENFHVLQALTYTHRDKIDCIYIDPPYNTGDKSWKYNNNYMGEGDANTHSKWLSFMEKRLRLAYQLLNKRDSVLICTIDEKEYLRLGLLLHDLFGKRATAIQMVSIVINPSGVVRDHAMKRTEEYAYFVYFGDAAPVRLKDTLFTSDARQQAMLEDARKGRETKTKQVKWERLLRGGSNSERSHSEGCFYPIYIDPESLKIVEIGEPLGKGVRVEDTPEREGLVTVFPLAELDGREKVWQMTPENLRLLVDDGIAKVGSYNRKKDRYSILYLGKGQRERMEKGEVAVVGRDGNGVKIVEAVQESLDIPRTIWNRQSHAAGEYGSRLINTFLGEKRFTFPKSLYAVEDTIRTVMANKPNGTVLDFFCGSGTTTHAVMRLNKQDGGHRRSIVVTNNEVSAKEDKAMRKQNLRPGDDEWEKHGVCDHVTKPRIAAAITGITPQGNPVKGSYKYNDEFPYADGIAANARYFTLTYENPLSVNDNVAFSRIAPLLWMKSGSLGELMDTIPESGWSGTETYAILHSRSGQTDFLAHVREHRETLTCCFIVTDDERFYQRVAGRVGDLEAVQLYSDYLSNFKFLNKEVD